MKKSYLKNLPIIFPARLRAMPLPMNALPAMLEAWLNLSQREKARVFVIVSIKAMAVTVSLSATQDNQFLLPFVLVGFLGL